MLSCSPSRFVAFIALTACAYAQQAQPTAIPRLIRFTGSYQQTHTGAVSATFSLYRQPHDGTPIWTEAQNVQPEKDGSYTVLLGAMRNEGMPLELFTAAEPRWLEAEIDQVKQPRVLLGSVPYALRAADSDTLGGLPASAFALAGVTPPSASQQAVIKGTVRDAVTGNAQVLTSPNYIPLTNGNLDFVNSAIYQANSSTVSIGGTSSLGALTLIGNAPFGDAAGMALYNTGGGLGASVSLDMFNTSANSGIPQATITALDAGAYSDHLTFWTKNPGGPTNPVTERLRITSAGNVGIGTATPGQKLEVNGFGKFSGGIIFSDGTQQTTAFTGVGTLTAIIAGPGLTGGGTSGAVTLSLDLTKIPVLSEHAAQKEQIKGQQEQIHALEERLARLESLLGRSFPAAGAQTPAQH